MGYTKSEEHTKLINDAVQARQAGMTYGQFMAQRYARIDHDAIKKVNSKESAEKKQ